MPPLPPVITSRTNARVKELRASLSGEARRPGDLLGLEGPNLLREAEMAGQSFQAVYLRAGSESLLEGAARWGETLRTGQWNVLAPDVFDSAVSTNHPQGIAATWVIKEPREAGHGFHAGLLAENLQDPGNLGTLIRSAAAFGVADVAITPDSVNQWNPKVVRSATGAIFRTRVQRVSLAEAVGQARSGGARIFAAVSAFGSSPERGLPLIGAPHGVLTGRRRNSEAPPEMRSRQQPWGLDDGTEHGYPASFSSDTDFVDPWVIIIGNEGAGLSPEARALADEEVSIPCGVESLNAAVAGSVLMYEAMRQIPLRLWAQRQGLRR